MEHKFLKVILSPDGKGIMDRLPYSTEIGLVSEDVGNDNNVILVYEVLLDDDQSVIENVLDNVPEVVKYSWHTWL